MEQRMSLKKALAVVICLLMLASVVPMNAFAVIENYNKDYQSETHTVFKHTEQTLAPGVTNYTNYAYSSDGKQMVYYVTTADLTRDDVVAQVAYKDMQNDVYGMDKLSNMVACANEKYTNPNDPLYISDYYTVVSACNGDGYNMTTGEPGGVFIMGGNVKKDWNKASNPVFLAILKDGSAVIDNTQEAWDACKEAGIREAIDIFGSNLVWDGKDVTANASGSYNTDRHSRTMVGITEDGKLVICVLDGRQEPFSCGGSMHELAQIMLEAGCVRAFNLDGGGSTTFMAKNEGTNDCVVINRPSDGSERSISNGIIIASTAAPSNTFDHVSMVAENEFVTPGSSTTVKVTGVSPAGTAAEIPADITYEVANGSFENGVLTSSAVGNVVLTAKYDGKEVGSLTVNSVIPEQIQFSSDSITIPYGKTAELELIATYGLNEVVTKASDFSFTLENASAGVVDGLSFTACDESTGITSSAITAAFVGSDLSADAQLVFGKGSEVIFDFEDGTTNGFKTGYGKYNYYLPNSETSVVSAENGKVHSGNYALAVNIDYSNSQESGYMMTALYRAGSDGDRPLVGAQRVGAWIYIPDEYVGLWARWVLYPITSVNEDGTVNIATDSITSNAMDNTAGGTGVVYSFNESGWHYLSCDFSQYAGAMWRDGYYCIQFYISDRDGASYNYYAKENHNINGDFTIYMDDFTVDYSSVIDDRDAPVFSSVNYATHGMSDAAVLNDGSNIGYNTVDFTASVADDMTKTNATGLDSATAKAYVDGNEVACTYKNGSIAMDNSAVLTAGEHTIKFSICDKQGNYASVIRKVNITTGNASAIKVVAHDSSLNRILFGSLYYVDVVADDIENVQSVTTTLNLDSMSKWELDHMVVADGFEATYTYEPADKILHLTLTKTGDVSATGEQALVSIPVRVWELKNAGSLIGGSTDVLPEENQYTYSWFKSQNEYWRVAVEVRIQQGYVTLADGATETFTGEHVFCDTEAWAIQKFMVETQEGKDYKAAWDGGHIHTVTALADKAATCTEPGYTGRTFCEVCNSVVDWGTTVPATGHTYDFVDGVRKCTCGELFNGEYEGKTYVDGVVIADGWHGESYYVDGVKQLGLVQIDGLYYDFGDDGVCEGKATIDGFYFDKTVNANRHFTAGTMDVGDVAIYPDVYFFDANGCAISGEVDIFGYKCLFSEKGAFVSSTDSSVIDAGYCGTNVYYVLLSNGILMVDGEGVMKDYTANGGHFPAWVIKNDSTKVQKLFFGNGITEIGRFGFYRNGYLRSIEFESGSTLKTIGWGAFGHCWRLASVTLPASVEELKEYAFYECGALKTVDFEEGSKLKSIGDYAFLHDIGLQSIYIPDNVAKIGVGVFIKANSSAVLNVVEGSVADLYATENGLLTVKRQGNVPPAYTGKCTDTISWELYPNGTLRLIGSGAMENYTSHSQQPWAAYRHKITKVVIDKDITSVGNYAFAYTQNLASVEFEEGSACKSIGVLSFMNAAKLVEVELPDSVDSISAYGFGCCYQLTSVILPQGISYIYPTAFMNSDKVVLNVAEGTFAETFAINNNIEYTTRAFIYVPFAEGKCGENAVWQMFENGELRINGSGSMENYTSHTQQPWASFRHKIKRVVIGKDITSVGNYAFAYTQNLANIEFEEGSILKSVGVLSFMNAAKLTEIVLPDTVNSISAYGLGCCYELTSIVLPQGISYIYPTAFMNSDKAVLNVAEGTFAETFAMKNNIAYTTRDFVYVPFAEGTCGETATWQLFENGELKINGSGAMENYTSHTQQPWANYRHLIKKVVIGKDITAVGNYAFAYTQNLASIEFEEGSVLKSIGVLSFMNAAKLTEVVLPDTVNSISAYGFGCCYQLTSVVLPQEISYIYTTAFSNSTVVTLNVASGSFAETYAINNGISYTTR